ncbi:MAG: glutamate synthase subunit beta [Betaproteobacteria bacterium]|nr:glutamate synthase subunit beta [Betaproteobacteria bacterium]
MGKTTGFLEIKRLALKQQPAKQRIRDWREFVLMPDDRQLSDQGARCMDCGIPYCQSGCPVNNVIPDFNDLVYRRDWKRAWHSLDRTNNFPEFTGRLCPAPCEAACTLYINDDAVTIKSIERAIVERAFAEGWVVPRPAAQKSGRSVAVVGSGPAGLACAQQLARAGHRAVVYEKSDRIGGLLRYGIPDFKMEKSVIDRRIEQLQAEGVEFCTGVHVGAPGSLAASELVANHDAVALCGGCEQPRDLPVPGRDLDGIHFAMDFLPLQNRRVAGESDVASLTARDKRVVVIGGGDTGSDCIGTSRRQGAASIVQFELLEQPPDNEDRQLSWPNWPLKMRTSSSHEEGCDRDWSVSTTRFSGNGKVAKLGYRKVQWQPGESGRMQMQPVGEEIEIDADLVLLAMGYVQPVHEGMLAQLGVEFDRRGNVQADTRSYQTSQPQVFVAGDMRRGQSLIVWAIREGRQCAQAIDHYLSGAGKLTAGKT